LSKDNRNYTIFEETLSEIAREIAGHVLYVPIVEPKIEYIIRVLRDSAEYITTALENLSEQGLKNFRRWTRL
jgi:hypothetical protein